MPKTIQLLLPKANLECPLQTCAAKSLCKVKVFPFMISSGPLNQCYLVQLQAYKTCTCDSLIFLLSFFLNCFVAGNNVKPLCKTALNNNNDANSFLFISLVLSWLVLCFPTLFPPLTIHSAILNERTHCVDTSCLEVPLATIGLMFSSRK